MKTETSKEATGWPTLGDAERATMREILVHGPRSRAETARILGLSRTSLTRVTRHLVDSGLLIGGETEVRGATGRPSELLRARLDSHQFLGIKLTGDTLYCVVTDLLARVVASVDQPLTDISVESTLDQLTAVYESLRTDFPLITAAGLCVAGDITSVDGHQVVIDSPYLGWRDVPAAQLLQERWGIPVTVENDVRALTAAEHWFGAGAGCSSLAVITVGTGVGVGIVSSDTVIKGHHGGAGRLDHLAVDSAGPVCALGHRGCVSVYLPSVAILRALQMPEIDYDGAVDLARSGHPAAIRAFNDAGHALGVLIGTVANMLDPEKIILTGDGLAVVELAMPRLEGGISSVRMPPTAETPLDVQPFEFTEWARAGAVSGIRHVLAF